MGVGYSVSPLHRIIHFDVSPITTRPPVKGSNSPIDRVAELMGTNVGVGTPRLHSPAIEVILAWRQGIATKYHDQLEERLTWDEDTTFEVSEDVATSGDVMLHYVAAILDQRGTSELNKLIDVTEPPRHGKLDRYGSVFHLVDEITTVRAAIADADPSLIHSSAAQTSDKVIVAAWQTSNTILRLATIATAKHLPLWTTG